MAKAKMTKTNKSDNRRIEEWFAEVYMPIAGGAGIAGEMSNPGVGDVGLNVFDLFPQAALTDIVRRALLTAWETIPSPGADIAPLKPTMDRLIRRDIAEVAPFGIGQFRAPNATPPIYNPKINFTEEVTELLILDEMSPISEDLYIRLTSDVAAIRARAGVDLATLGKILQLRFERLTEVMRWQIFKGNPLVINYSGGQSYEIKYNYLETHKPFAAVPWTDRGNSTPIDDLRSWQKIIGNDTGVYGSRIHMNSYTYEKLQRSNQARGYLTNTDRNSFLPTPDDILGLLWGSTPSDAQGGVAAEPPKIIVSDAGYREETNQVATEYGYNRGQSAMTTYLQNGEVLMTTDYVFEGENIADVADGPVLLSDTWNSLKKEIGPQSEIIIDHESKTTYLRQGCSRFPRLRRPQCFLLGRAF